MSRDQNFKLKMSGDQRFKLRMSGDQNFKLEMSGDQNFNLESKTYFVPPVPLPFGTVHSGTKSILDVETVEVRR